jgi:hypothetical protein
MRRVVFAGLLLAGGLAADHIHLKNKIDVRDLIERAERRSDHFNGPFKDAIDHSSLNRTREEKKLRNSFKAIEQALDHLKKNKSPRPAEEVARAVGAAGEINRVVAQGMLGTDIVGDWEGLRNDLNALAQVFRVRIQ